MSANPVRKSPDRDVYEEVCTIVHQLAGIQLGDKQRGMVEGRIKKRFRDLGLTKESEYLAYLEQNKKTEVSVLVSLLTTHHTYFFREFSHFTALEKTILPNAIKSARARGDKKIRLWSAACSRGQEAYSLAMFLDFHLKAMAPDCSFEIVASDVDAESVGIGKNGVYQRSQIKEVPATFLGQHWARGTGDIAEYVKAKDSLKRYIRFESGNLLEVPVTKYGQSFDIIFCRNVFIYFTPAQIEAITKNLVQCLRPEGHLFIGLSESLHGMKLNLKSSGPSIYTNALSVVPSSAVGKPSASGNAPTPALQTTGPLKVLCVDDSVSILSLLKKILTADQGFEVVAIAKNGLEAKAMLQQHQVDVVTLDLHMPEQGGLDYLRQNHRAGHPPVVIISSVPREDANLAMAALDAGASDYIEKPTLTDLSERGDEIRMKLTCAVQLATAAKLGKPNTSTLDRQFSHEMKIQNPEKKLRVILARMGDGRRLQSILRDLPGSQPPTLILVEGAGASIGALATQLGSGISVWDGLGELAAGKVFVADFKSVASSLGNRISDLQSFFMVLGQVSRAAADKILAWRPTHLLIEDLPPTGHKRPGDAMGNLKTAAFAAMPITSFAYTSIEYLSREGSSKP